jgi:O-antigen/teichoic acid export membrane protein
MEWPALVQRIFSKDNREAATYMIGTACQRLGLFLVLPILLRRLTVTEYGTFGLAQSAMTLLPAVLTLNIPATVTRLYFDQRVEEERRGVAAKLSLLCLCLALISVVLAGGAALAFQEGIARTLGVRTSVGFEVSALVLLGAVGSALLQMGYGIWRAQHKAFLSAGANVLSSVLFLIIASVLAIARRLDLMSAIGSYAIASLAVGGLACGLAAPWKDLTKGPQMSTLFHEALQYGIPILPYLLSTWFLAAGGRWIGRATLDLSAVAEFTLASQLAFIVNLLGRATYEAWAPRGFALFATGRHREGFQYFRTKGRQTVLFVGAVSLVIEFVAATLLPRFAPSYSRVTLLFPILVCGALIDVATLVAHNVLMGLKRTRVIGWYTAVSVLSFALLGILLSRAFAIWGLAGAFLSAYVLQWILAMGVVRRLRNNLTARENVPLPALEAPVSESLPPLA